MHQQSSAHNEVQSTTDFKLIIVLLTKNEIFSRTSGRNHASFFTPRHPLHAKNYEKVIAWIKEHAKHYFSNQTIILIHACTYLAHDSQSYVTAQMSQHKHLRPMFM